MRKVQYTDEVHKKRRELANKNYNVRGKYVTKLRWLEKTLGVDKTDTSNLSTDYIIELVKDLSVKKMNKKLGLDSE